ncbi:hypothetical protein ABT116_29885 [Streptomyces sp. NPDC002130]|uniref:hypothetical protein n=1 Tax=Streptomyces sp. NPDC002130 TaxID=3155568 RepID=UPI00331C0E2F
MQAEDDLLAFEITRADFQALTRVIEHARERLEAESGADRQTIRNASGEELLPLLYSRAGAAIACDGDGVPMLVCEIRHLDAAVVNLESYGGHETILCEGHTLLERFAVLSKQTRAALTVDGILRLPRSTPQTPCG